jgi:hypothetical protein
VSRRVVILFVLAVALCAGAAASARDAGAKAAEPIVVLERRGGLCFPGNLCRTVIRITDTAVTRRGYLPRRLAPAERAALLRAIRALDVESLRPFEGICPVAYDGQESVYRFRGVRRALASCTYELDGLRAVRLAQRLAASLKPR